MTRETTLVLRRVKLALALFLLLVVVGTTGYRLIVGGSLLDCLYMTFITLTSVGYGEVLPGLEQSAPGRVFTMMLIAMGVALSVFLVSSLTAFLVEGELIEILRRRRMDKSIAKMKGHVVVCGTGTTGVHVVSELLAVGEPMVPIDVDEDRIYRALGELGIMERVGLPVLALEAGDGIGVSYYPGPETLLSARSKLVVLAERAQVKRLRELVQGGDRS